jgi:hypothetical protein
MAGVLTPGGYVFQNQFFREQIDAIFQSLQFRHLGASDPEGF